MTTFFEETAEDNRADELESILALHAIAMDGLACGICVFDDELRIALYNRRYPEILRLSPQVVRPGVSLRTVLKHTGTALNLSDASIGAMWRDLRKVLALKNSFSLRRQIATNVEVTFHFQPLAGGWVCTCEDMSEQHRTSQELQTEINRLKRTIENISHGICLFDAEQRLVMCNDRYLKLYGYTREQLLPGMTFRDILEHAISIGTYSGITTDELYHKRNALLRHEPAVQQIQLQDGRVIQITVRPIGTDGWVAEHEDLTVHVHYEEELRRRNQLLDATLEHMAHGLCAYDKDFRVIFANRCYLDIYGLNPEDALPGTPMIELIRRSIERGIHRPGISAEEMLTDLKQRLIDDKEPVLHRELADGRIIAVRHQPIASGGWVGTYEDITERCRAEKHIAHIARHDALTDLPNRLLFREKMADGLARVERGECSMAIMCLDLDNFKAVNDSLGHPIGDRLLQFVAERCRGIVNNSDTIARIGGDEFAILHFIKRPRDAAVLAKRLIAAMSTPIVINGQDINTGISIGIAIAPDDGRAGDHLMKCADLALYRAKNDGRNIFRLFEQQMDVEIQLRRAIELDLRQALTAGELRLAFQPQADLATNALLGMEALLRWNHPERGSVSPTKFIPIAEETRLIVPIGEWVLRQACTEAAQWPDNIRIAVNLSPVQFRNHSLVRTVTHALAAAGISARRLELEITEAVLLQNDEMIINTLHQLRELGVRIVMDDFGTGYSSLSYLRSFPFDKIKLDQSFISEAGRDPSSGAIIRTIAELGISLGIEITAEGIETVDQLEVVRQAGYTEGQGYLIGQPCNALEARAFIARSRRRAA